MDTELARLAAAHGVATWYENDQRQRVTVDPDVVVAVLERLGVDAATPAAVRRELDAVAATREPTTLPPTLVVRQGSHRHLPAAAELRCEDGTERRLTDGLPPDLPLGYHHLTLGHRLATVIVTPPCLTPPARSWGWALQLYALRSAGSWGMGDLGDLRDFARWAARGLGAGLVLCNPLHAITPLHPVPASPYSPSSRRCTNPLYLRVTDTAAYHRADPETRHRIDEMRPSSIEVIDYDAVWAAKRSALELLWQRDQRRSDQHGNTADTDAPVDAVADFATFCALAERHGPDWRGWPAPLRHPASSQVAAARVELAPRVAFHAWLQRQCDSQLAAAQHAARNAGMPLGIVHDLAVGVDPGGADAWALQDVIGTGVTIGAPPDAFSQRGQDWQLAPWRPDRLAVEGYRPLRDMVRAVLRHAGGIRVDHVMGLWRMWWIPPGEPPVRGTYVHYDAEAMLAVLTLEARRAGAVVIGEDLGTVEPAVRTRLRRQEVLGTAVLWFQRDDDAPGRSLLPPEQWPSLAAASISTHDLPTAHGFLRGEHVRVRADLGLLDDPAREARQAASERTELLALLRDQGLLGDAPTDGTIPVDGTTTGDMVTEDDIVVAMHRFLTRTPCRLLLASPYDVLGETRQPNLPGTVDEYPNWRLPLPVTLEKFREDPRVRRIAGELAAWERGTRPRDEVAHAP
ncbi:4-alpha-glucanotransferase [Longimycelium tulufanense]|uniref:4-alpha-glucanotransferase n=1 Tax=Longimycelium tulufanense TaxID=907463 RepID=A0A8J3CBM6_9PSEU|nr:4-alpha-glucanotransferase [Longimycelium tulufanense]GGM49679.1 4-alpha-glucanotransferase [Longimycelium tulufanense]